MHRVLPRFFHRQDACAGVVYLPGNAYVDSASGSDCAQVRDVRGTHERRRVWRVGQAYEIFDPLDEWYVAGLLADAGGAA